MKRFLLLMAALAFTHSAQAATPNKSILDEISFNPPLGNTAPIDLPFRDEAGVSTTLRALLNGKPALLVPVYYSCPSLCTLSLNGVLKAARALRLTAGTDYTVIALSINPKDTPELSAAKRASYRNGYSRATGDAGWRFLTGDQPAIDTLTRAIGFFYVYNATTEQYGHSSSLVVLTPDGKISRGLNGPEFEPKDLKLALIEAGEGKIGTLVDRAITYCFTYDGSTGKYSMQILRVVQLAGAATALAVLFMIALQIWNERRRRYAGAGGTH